MGTDFERQARRAVAEQRFVQFEFHYPAWDRWFENRLYPSPEGLTVLLTDITERNRSRRSCGQASSVRAPWPRRCRTSFGPTCRTVSAIGSAVNGANTPASPSTSCSAWAGWIGFSIRTMKAHPGVLERGLCGPGRLRPGVSHPPLRRRVPLVQDAACRSAMSWARSFIGSAPAPTSKMSSGWKRRSAEADRRKDEFLATLAHELRNPLAPLRNGLQFMRLAGDDRADRAGPRHDGAAGRSRWSGWSTTCWTSAGSARARSSSARSGSSWRTSSSSAIETSRPLIESDGHDLAVRYRRNRSSWTPT